MISDAKIAKRVSELLLEAAAQLEESVAIVSLSKCSDLEKDRYVALVGEIIGTLGLDLLNPLFHAHRGIKPPDYYLPEIKPE